MSSRARRRRRSPATIRSSPPVAARASMVFQVSYQDDCTPVVSRALGYYGGFMRHRVSLAFMLLSLCACGPTEDSHMKAIIGAVLIDGVGGPPISSPVVVLAGEGIRAARSQSTI